MGRVAGVRAGGATRDGWVNDEARAGRAADGPADAHAATSARSAARNMALRARGLAATSSSEARSGFFVRIKDLLVLTETSLDDAVLQEW